MKLCRKRNHEESLEGSLFDDVNAANPNATRNKRYKIDDDHTKRKNALSHFKQLMDAEYTAKKKREYMITYLQMQRGGIYKHKIFTYGPFRGLIGFGISDTNLNYGLLEIRDGDLFHFEKLYSIGCGVIFVNNINNNHRYNRNDLQNIVQHHVISLIIAASNESRWHRKYPTLKHPLFQLINEENNNPNISSFTMDIAVKLLGTYSCLNMECIDAICCYLWHNSWHDITKYVYYRYFPVYQNETKTTENIDTLIGFNKTIYYTSEAKHKLNRNVNTEYIFVDPRSGSKHQYQQIFDCMVRNWKYNYNVRVILLSYIFQYKYGFNLQTQFFEQTKRTKTKGVSVNDINKIYTPFESPPLIQQKYTKMYNLGVGGFGSVDLCQRNTKTRRLYAIKSVKLRIRHNFDVESEFEYDGNSAINSEVNIMRYVNANPHRNVIKMLDHLYGVYKEFIIMDFCFDLTYLLKYNKLSYFNKTKIILSIMFGLQHLHGIDIKHCDIKPSNILFNRFGIVKIADFGCSLFTDCCRTTKGTLNYLSPQQLLAAKYGFGTKEGDVFALGLTIGYIFTEHHIFSIPHGTHDNKKINIYIQYKHLMDHDYNKYDVNTYTSMGDIMDGISEKGWEELLLSMLQETPTNRINTEELILNGFIQSIKNSIYEQTLKSQGVADEMTMRMTTEVKQFRDCSFDVKLCDIDISTLNTPSMIKETLVDCKNNNEEMMVVTRSDFDNEGGNTLKY